MPTIQREGDLYTLGYITGPSHIWLRIRFSREPIADPEVIAQPGVGECDHGKLDAHRIVGAAVAGAAAFGLYPQRIEYVSNDTPRYDLYEHCAGLLAKRASNEMD